MAKISGIGHHLILDSTDLSGDVGSLDNASGGRAPLDVTGISSSSPERILGMRSGALAFSAWWNYTGAHPVIDTMPATDRIATYAAYTTTAGAVGDVAASIVGKQLEWSAERAADGALMAKYSMESNGFPLEWGNLLTTGLQTFGAAGNGTSWDRTTVTSSYGAAAYLHVSAFTGTSAAISVTDSANNSTFASCGLSFSSVTGATKERIVTSLTQTVRRYFRVEITGTFSNLVCLVVLVPYDLSQAT